MVSEAKDFHIGDVLSITTGRLLSPRGMDGVYDILNWMTDDELFTHQLPRAARECSPWLAKQHPALASEAMQAAAEKFGDRLGTITDRSDRDAALAAWLSEQAAIHGEMFSVERAPIGSHVNLDPTQELIEKVGPDRVVVVGTP